MPLRYSVMLSNLLVWLGLKDTSAFHWHRQIRTLKTFLLLHICPMLCILINVPCGWYWTTNFPGTYMPCLCVESLNQTRRDGLKSSLSGIHTGKVTFWAACRLFTYVNRRDMGKSEITERSTFVMHWQVFGSTTTIKGIMVRPTTVPRHLLCSPSS